MNQPSPKTIYLKDYLAPDFLVDQVELRFELHEEETLVFAKLEFFRNPDRQSSNRQLRLHGEGLESLGLWIDGKELDQQAYVIDAEGLLLKDVPERFTLQSKVRIHPQKNTALEGLYKSGSIFCTQCEAEGFRKITWFQDRPDVMARFTTTIVADPQKYPILLSNGNPIATEQLEDGRQLQTWQDPFPKPAYLFALVAGDLRVIKDQFTTLSGRNVDLRIYVEAENLDKCDHAMASLKKAMSWDEEVYGREYDLDIYMIVAVNDFNMGAMENKGLNIFNTKFVLARKDTATDRDFQGIEGVIAHEYFHNWTGNRITCRDWFQLSLKEGLTVFRDQEFSADMGSRGVRRIDDVRLLRQHQFAEDSGPMAHPIRPASYIEINNFYTVTVYEKGAEVVRMQRNLLGDKDWRKATDLYFERHDGQAVTTEDFVQCMEDASGRNLSQFQHWYHQAGTPQLHVTDAYDESSSTYTLTLHQSCPATPGQRQKPDFHIPFALGLLGRDGADLPICLKGETSGITGTRLLEITATSTQYSFIGLTERPVPSLLRGLSAPVKIHFDYTDADLMFLMAHDSDDFNRWDAGQTLMQRILLKRVEDQQAALPEGFMAAIKRVLQDTNSDQALLALLLELPSEAWLGDQMSEVDVEGLHTAREGLMTEIAGELRETLLQVYRENGENGDYDISSASISRRALKNRCLIYLMQLKDDEIAKLCIDQYQAAHNMTDVMTALQLIAHSDLAQRQQILEDFRSRWLDDPLVLDKWFMVQALSKRPDTGQAVKKLMQDQAFSLSNPNRVRALIGAFCSANLKGFHGVDGSGYAFLTDRVIELDETNPQIAARLLRTMARWRRYDSTRQKLMRDQLARILTVKNISRDVFEVASKSIGGS